MWGRGMGRSARLGLQLPPGGAPRVAGARQEGAPAAPGVRAGQGRSPGPSPGGCGGDGLAP